MESRVDTFANRLNIAMNNKNINQVELSEKTKVFPKPISQSLINKYLKGKSLARQNNIYILAKILDVDEAWLMGFDVPMPRTPDELRGMEADFKFASYNGIDTKDLDEEDIEEINRFVEFIRNKKKNEKKK